MVFHVEGDRRARRRCRGAHLAGIVERDLLAVVLQRLAKRRQLQRHFSEFGQARVSDSRQQIRVRIGRGGGLIRIGGGLAEPVDAGQQAGRRQPAGDDERVVDVLTRDETIDDTAGERRAHDRAFEQIAVSGTEQHAAQHEASAPFVACVGRRPRRRRSRRYAFCLRDRRRKVIPHPAPSRSRHRERLAGEGERFG